MKLYEAYLTLKSGDKARANEAWKVIELFFEELNQIAGVRITHGFNRMEYLTSIKIKETVDNIIKQKGTPPDWKFENRPWMKQMNPRSSKPEMTPEDSNVTSDNVHWIQTAGDPNARPIFPDEQRSCGTHGPKPEANLEIESITFDYSERFQGAMRHAWEFGKDSGKTIYVNVPSESEILEQLRKKKEHLQGREIDPETEGRHSQGEC